LKKLGETKILNFHLTAAKQNQVFYNENIAYTLNNETILVTANKLILSIAGILNNKEYEVDENSTHVLIESLSLNKKNIKRTTKLLGIRTPNSIALEKGISTGIRNLAFQHIIKLISLTTRFENKIIKLNIRDNEARTQKLVQLNLKNVKNILGKPKKRILQPTNVFTNLEILSCIKKLGYKIIKIENEVCHLFIPSNRENQIQNANDVVEEIGRIYSYNNIESILPITKKQGKISQRSPTSLQTDRCDHLSRSRAW
jgi:phenylalanyl-tRNA synthetase beta chain